MKIKRFEELPVWKLALEATKVIYDLTSQPKFSSDFALRDQIRRAVISVSSNIVEGFEKNNNNEFIRFLKIAKGSAGEVRNQLYIALTVGHISQEQFDEANSRIEELAGQIGGLITYLEKCRKEGKFTSKKSVNPLMNNSIIKNSLLKITAVLVIVALNWSGISAIYQTSAYYGDIEDSPENNYAGGTLDFALESLADFAPTPVLPGESATRTIDFINYGNAPKYIVYATSSLGELCDYLTLEADLDGTTTFSGNLKDFETGINLFGDPDKWTFAATLNSDTPVSLQEQTCNFKFVFFGSQQRNDLPLGGGFNDIEEIDNTITAGVWQKIVINKVYYDPDDGHSGEGTERKYEWIELYNPTDEDVDLKKWIICDNTQCATIDNNVVIPSLGYALVVHDAEIWKYWEIIDGAVFTYTLSGNFAMANDADMLLLKNASSTIVDQMNWGIPNVGWANYNDDVWNPGVPDAPEGHMLARVPSGYDTDQPSDWFDLGLPQVDLTYPAGGEVWYVGNNYDILWTATNPNGPDIDLIIDLYYSNDSGNTWATIATSTENDGAYNWRVPLYLNGYYTPSHKARIKIKATGPENFMVQDWDMSEDFCPPIDYSLLTEEERAQVDELLALGILTVDDLINYEAPVEVSAIAEDQASGEIIMNIPAIGAGEILPQENIEVAEENATTAEENEDNLIDQIDGAIEEIVEEIVEEILPESPIEEPEIMEEVIGEIAEEQVIESPVGETLIIAAPEGGEPRLEETSGREQEPVIIAPEESIVVETPPALDNSEPDGGLTN